MNNLFEKQNSEDNLNLLVIQRGLYSRAKRWNFWKMIFCSAIPVVVGIVNAILSLPGFQWVLPFLLLLAFLADYLFHNRIRTLKSLAARFQQRFDVGLFGLGMDPLLYLFDPLPSEDEYKENRVAFEKIPRGPLQNWYGDHSHLAFFQAVYACQRENLSWNKKLVKYYKIWMTILLIAYPILAVIIGCVLGYSLQDFLILAISFFPLTRQMITTLQMIKQDVQWFERMGQRVPELDEKKSALAPNQMKNECEKIQFQIFNHRMEGYLIPDWFYRITKPFLEKQDQIH